jgi:hypothetical protein
MFSFGLIVPDPVEFDVRMVPWPFVMTKEVATDNMAFMGQMYAILEQEYNTDDTFILWMEDDNSEREDIWYSFEEDKNGRFDRYEETLLDNRPLIAAMFFSFVLSLVGAILGTITLFFIMKMVADNLWEGLEHRRRYKKAKIAFAKREESEYAYLAEREDQLRNAPVEGKGQLPPAFAIPDLMVVRFIKGKVNSLAKFLNIVVVEEKDSQSTMIRTKMYDIKERYEAFCFINEYKEQIIRDNITLMFQKDLEFSTQSDSTTEVFKNIRFKTPREMDENIMEE